MPKDTIPANVSTSLPETPFTHVVQPDALGFVVQAQGMYFPPGGAAPPRIVTSAEGGWRGKDAHSLHIMWTKPPGDTKSPVTYKVTVCGQMSDDTPKGPREGHDVNGAVEAYKRHEHFTRRARGRSGQDQRCAGLGCGLPQIRFLTLDAG
jgi:hypothetical protein